MKLFHHLTTRERFRHFVRHMRYLLWVYIGHKWGMKL